MPVVRVCTPAFPTASIPPQVLGGSAARAFRRAAPSIPQVGGSAESERAPERWNAEDPKAYEPQVTKCGRAAS